MLAFKMTSLLVMLTLVNNVTFAQEQNQVQNQEQIAKANALDAEIAAIEDHERKVKLEQANQVEVVVEDKTAETIVEKTEAERIAEANELDAQTAAIENEEFKKINAAKVVKAEEDKSLEEKLTKLEKTIADLEDKVSSKDKEIEKSKKEFEDFRCKYENPYMNLYYSLQNSINANTKIVSQMLEQQQSQFNKWLDITYQGMNKPSIPSISPFDPIYIAALNQSFDSRIDAIFGNIGRQNPSAANIYQGDVTYNLAGNGMGLNDQNSWRIPRTDLMNGMVSPYANSAMSFDQDLYRNPARFDNEAGVSWLNNSIRPYGFDFSR